MTLYIHKLVVEEVMETLEKKRKIEEKKLYVYNKVRETLKPFDGKIINVRMIKAIKAALPGLTVNEYGWNEKNTGVVIWNDLDKWPYGKAMWIRYQHPDQRSERFNFSMFDYANGTTAELPQRIEEMERVVTRIPGWVRRWNNAVEELEAVHEETEPCYLSWDVFNTPPRV